METITIYKDSYEKLRSSEFEYLTAHAHLQGTIIALADIIKTNPAYVAEKLSELAEQFKGDRS